MKKIVSVIVLFISMSINAQVSTPAASTSANLEQIVGLTTIEVTYARPATKGRVIFGDLVPFDKKWRTGANANTIVSFSDDVKIEGNAIKSGSYALYSIPRKDSWTVYLYDKIDNWGLPQEWQDDLVVAKFDVKSKKSEQNVENFTIQLKDIQTNKAHLQIAWEQTYVEFPIEVPTDKKVMASIEETLNGEAKARDYYNAAVYFLETGKDINQAVEWVDMAMQMQENKPFWMLRQQSLIYHKAGKKKEAIKIAEASLEAAKEAGNADYVKMNMDSLNEWR